MAVSEADVLMISRDVQLVERVSSYLRDTGYSVLVATGATETFEHLGVAQISILLLDLDEPSVASLAFSIRARSARTAVIGISERPSDMPYVADCLPKPIEYERLFEVLDKHLPPAIGD